VATFLSVVALIVALAALALAGQRFLRERMPGSDDGVSVGADGGEHPGGRSVARIESAVKQLAANQKKLAELAQASVRHVGVVRYDAFEDMGGRLSFSAAILDGNGDGLVITSINGRQDTRCYAKQVQNWTSIHNLSDEERQAIREALGRADQRATSVRSR
jgi:Protein of unknown function (DUF4446)